jgi:hypothetical protein
MLNINAFFEFKQRTRHIHSFQLAQLIYHAQHLTDYYTLPQAISTETNRRISIPASDDAVSLFSDKTISIEFLEKRRKIFLVLYSFIPFFLCDCVYVLSSHLS